MNFNRAYWYVAILMYLNQMNHVEFDGKLWFKDDEYDAIIVMFCWSMNPWNNIWV